jgi:mannose-1-phosphate guanylyltransferase/mannose-6-phosphate isomerase
MTRIVPVILCGGSGTRLWPLSRAAFPKQFLSLSGCDSEASLFQETLLRANKVLQAIPDGVSSPAIVVINEDHRFLALDQLQALLGAKANLLLEPAARNTAPALTAAALFALSGADDPILIVIPSDQFVQNDPAFVSAIEKCIQLVKADQQNRTLAILGIKPIRPETGFGYIKSYQNLSTGQEFLVEEFVEKPDFATAQSYIASGNYYWNAGMFVLKASTWLSALNEFRPDIFAATKLAMDSLVQEKSGDSTFIRPLKDQFNVIPSESIDYAVIEKCSGSKFQVVMVELDAGWSDLGAWDTVWQAGKKDQHNNLSVGDTILSDVSNSLIYSSNRLVSAIGVQNLVIVETADAVIVADRSKSQDVKNIVTQLDKEKREEKNLHRKVARPWGWYDTIDQGERFKVKRIQVKPGASLSLQMHHHRAEHWIIVKGVAQITNGKEVIILKENESTYIPKGQIHRLENFGVEPLEIIEVQSGDYLGEDDIVRFEDVYGRSNT